MKNIFLAILIVLFLTKSYSQKETFFDGIETLRLPVTIDQISFNNLKKFDNINYKKISSYLFNENLKIGFDSFDKTNNIYIYGKYKVKEKTAIIIFIESHKNKSITSYLLIYSKDFDLVDFVLIGNNLYLGKKSEPLISYSLINDNFIKVFNNKNNEIIFYKINEMDIVSFDCEENIECINFKPKLDSIPQRNYIKYFFNKKFFENKILLLPFKECSPLNYSKTIVDINGNPPTNFKNYFIDSKKLLNGNIIIFFLNTYDFKDFKDFKEVGYLLFSSEGKLKKIDSIASYKIDVNDNKTISASSIFLYEDFILIKKTTEDKETYKIN